MIARSIATTILGMSLFAGGAATFPSAAQAGACFDRCMTRCHLPSGYRYCRNDCFYLCDRRRYR